MRNTHFNAYKNIEDEEGSLTKERDKNYDKRNNLKTNREKQL